METQGSQVSLILALSHSLTPHIVFLILKKSHNTDQHAFAVSTFPLLPYIAFQSRNLCEDQNAIAQIGYSIGCVEQGYVTVCASKITHHTCCTLEQSTTMPVERVAYLPGFVN